MCNARNHYDGCDCGFGPPYPWKIKADPRKNWHEMALLDIITYKRNLKDLGLSKTQIDDEIKRYKEQGFPISTTNWAAFSSDRKADWKSRFLNFFRPYKYEEIEFIDSKVDIPIFRLHSPEIESSSIGMGSSLRLTLVVN